MWLPLSLCHSLHFPLRSSHWPTMVVHTCFSIQERTEHRSISERPDKIGEGSIMHFHPGNSTHSGLYGLRVIYIYRILRADNMFDAKPVGQTDNGTQISGILHIVQCKAKRLADCFRIQSILWLFENGKYLLGSFQ